MKQVTRVWPREEAIDEALARDLGDGQACSLSGHDLDWNAAIDAVARAAGARPLDAVTARLALREACARAAARSGWARVAAVPGFLAAAATALEELERAGVAGAEIARGLRQARPKDADEAAAFERLGLWARVAEAYAALVEGAGASTAARQALARAWLERGGKSPFAGAVEILPRAGWCPADVALCAALATHAPVAVTLVHASEPAAVFAGLEPVIAAFEARHETPGLSLELTDGLDGAQPTLAAVARALGGDAPAPEPPAGGPPPLTILAAPTETAELRAIAGRARELIDAGTPPERIAVAARQPEALGAGLIEALARAGVAVDDRRGQALADTPLGRLVLGLLALADDGFAVEPTLAVIGSRYLAGPRLAREVRERGLGDLGRAARAQLARSERGPQLAERLARVLAPIEALPEQGTIAAHTAALAAALERLDVLRRARTLEPGDGQGDPAPAEASLEARITRAQARDQAAADAVQELLAGLGAAAARLGVGARTISRKQLAALLADLMAQTRLRPIGARGGAVKLVHLGELASRRFEHLIVPRMVDGVTPARGGDDGLFGARERRALNRLCGRQVVSVARAGGDDDRTPYELAYLWQALAAAQGSITFTWARETGARSSFLDSLRVAAPWAREVELGAAPVPAPRAARAPADVLAGAALSLYASPALRSPRTAPLPARPLALYRAVRAAMPARLQRLAALARVERERWRYFARQAAPGRFAGAIGPMPLAARAGTAEAPLSASQLERLANCPFTFLAGRLLRVDESEEPGPSPDPRRLGSAAHAVLQRFYLAREQAGRLPVACDDDDRQALGQVVDEVFAELQAQGAPGHPTLWGIARARLVGELWQLLEAEHDRQAELDASERATPAHFELGFGDGEKLPALVVGDGAAAVHVKGRVDRVDVVAGKAGAVVIDYKLGRLQSHEAKLRNDALGVTALQLPIYARAVRDGLRASGALREGASCDAAFLTLRDGGRSTPLGAKVELGVLLDEALPARLVELATRARAGALEIAPVDCARCSFRTVCRVVALEEPEEDQ